MTDRDNRVNRYFNKYDILLAFCFIFSALMIMVCLKQVNAAGSFACVYVNGELKGRYLLTQDAEVTIDGYNNGHNVLVIKDGMAYMKEASCPDGLCIHQGKISRSEQSVVCLPNRIVIQIEGTKGGEYDAITQ